MPSLPTIGYPFRSSKILIQSEKVLRCVSVKSLTSGLSAFFVQGSCRCCLTANEKTTSCVLKEKLMNEIMEREYLETTLCLERRILERYPTIQLERKRIMVRTTSSTRITTSQLGIARIVVSSKTSLQGRTRTKSRLLPLESISIGRTPTFDTALSNQCYTMHAILRLSDFDATPIMYWRQKSEWVGLLYLRLTPGHRANEGRLHPQKIEENIRII